MEIRQLKYFTNIADTCSFSETSRRMFISQSAVSQQIKALEEELGVQLFVRKSHLVSLTESGRELLPLARQILEFVSDCNERMNALKGLMCGEMNIGATFSMEPFLRYTITDFMRKYPNVKIKVHYLGITELFEMLKNNSTDIVYSIITDEMNRAVESEPIAQYYLGAIMRKEHPLANKATISINDLVKQVLILPEKEINDHNAIEKFLCHDANILNIRGYINDSNALLNLLQSSNYISILAEQSISAHPLLKCIRIEEIRNPIKVYAHFNNNIVRKNSVNVFHQMLKDTIKLYKYKT